MRSSTVTFRRHLKSFFSHHVLTVYMAHYKFCCMLLLLILQESCEASIMVAPARPRYTPTVPSPPSSPEILKRLKFKQRSRDRRHTRFGGIFNPCCGTRHIFDAFAKFKERGFIPKTIKNGLFTLGGTCCSGSTCQIY